MKTEFVWILYVSVRDRVSCWSSSFRSVPVSKSTLVQCLDQCRFTYRHWFEFPSKHLYKQECIPVGCVPAARRPYAGVCFPGRSGPGGCLVWGGVWSGGVWSGGVSGPGGVWSGGVCLVWGGVSGRGWCLVWGGVPGPGGVLGLGGWCAWSGGVCFSALWDTTTPPVNRMTNRCKNITLATTSLRPVINSVPDQCP